MSTVAMESFSAVPQTLPVGMEVFILMKTFTEDKFPKKVNLGMGVYRQPNGKSWVMPSVQEAKERLIRQDLNHEYLPISGLAEYAAAGIRLLLGENSVAIKENKVGAVQALGSTGSLRLGLQFLHDRLGLDTAYIPQPTWVNHHGLCSAAGYSHINQYTYLKKEIVRFDFDGMMNTLRQAPSRSVVILQLCAHVPTGEDPTREQWKKIAALVQERNLFPFFDCTYHGFASGCVDTDSYALRLFVDEGIELFASESYSKNFGLYGERVGQLVYVVNNSEDLPKIRSSMELIVRQTWSNPPAFGCRIVSLILNDKQLEQQWRNELKLMTDELQSKRRTFHDKLTAAGVPCSQILEQRGMFCYLGLTEAQCRQLLNEFHIYVMKNARINLSGLTADNIDYVVEAVQTVCKDTDSKL